MGISGEGVQQWAPFLYRPYPSQRRFHESDAPFRLLVGDCGSGRTTALVWEAVARCLQYPGINAGLFRRTNEQLASFIPYFISQIDRHIYNRYDVIGRLLEFPDVDGRVSRLFFSPIETINDVRRFGAVDFGFLGFDRIDKMDEMLVVEMTLRLRRRYPDLPTPRLAGTANRKTLHETWADKTFDTEGHEKILLP